ncbi:MAG: DUF2220 family protein [Eubacteriales bacterium]|nr:DUF2220 family protein [Eubacteriales bacterium]
MYEKKILTGLLDSYENSLLSTGENKVAIRIAYAFTAKQLPAYFDESSTAYEEIHAGLKALQDRGFVEILWKKGKEGHIISKVFLNAENAGAVYEYMKREPKTDMERSALRALREIGDELAASAFAENRTPVTLKFITYLRERLTEHKSVKEYADIGDIAGIRRLIHALRCVEENEEPAYIREFSIRSFGDSKIFESMIGLIGKVFRNFGESDANADAGKLMDDKSILAEYGIYHTPNYVYMKGTGVFTLGGAGGRIDLSALSQGIGISGADIGALGLMEAGSIKRVITVENLTSYYALQVPDSLIIYLGGYHNGVRRQLLKIIYENASGAEYLHFGDIDIGGFEIYEDLKRRSGIDFKTWHMGITELKRYEKYARELTENDRKRLDKLLQEKSGEDCAYYDVLLYMKEHGIKLEQECCSAGADRDRFR